MSANLRSDVSAPVPEVKVSGHFITRSAPTIPSVVSIAPADAQQSFGTSAVVNEHYEPLNLEAGRLPCIYPSHPTSFNDRCVLPYEAKGYVHISPRDNQPLGSARFQGINDVMGGTVVNPEEFKDILTPEEQQQVLLAEQEQAPPLSDFVTPDAFQQIVEGFKGGDGKFLAMTAYGSIPLPDQLLQSIPEKFMTKPLIQEREVFVLKQDHQVRITERDYTQYNHNFVPINKNLIVDRVEPVEDVKIIEVPHFQYKPVIEDKIVEIPYGIKYVEVPIEVECQKPPKIVPIPKPHIIERIIETTKPVVQEKIIEVPEVVKKKVPRVVTKEIPYVVAKYVEKIVEVPYKPGQKLPPQQGSPMSLIPKPPKLPTPGTAATYPTQPARAPPQLPSAKIEDDTLIVEEGPSKEAQTFYLSQEIKHIKLPYEARIDVTVVQEDEIPPGTAIAQKGVRYMAPGPKAVAYNEISPKNAASKRPDEPVYAGPMDPIIEHAAPGMRAVEFRTRSEEPDILTQQGVLKYSKFECCLQKNINKLLPKLPQHDLVPMDPLGTPSLKGLTFIHAEHAARMGCELSAKHTYSNKKNCLF